MRASRKWPRPRKRPFARRIARRGDIEREHGALSPSRPRKMHGASGAASLQLRQFPASAGNQAFQTGRRRFLSGPMMKGCSRHIGRIKDDASRRRAAIHSASPRFFARPVERIAGKSESLNTPTCWKTWPPGGQRCCLGPRHRHSLSTAIFTTLIPFRAIVKPFRVSFSSCSALSAASLSSTIFGSSRSPGKWLCLFACATAMSMIRRARRLGRRRRHGSCSWPVPASSSGSGIWGTHFVAMLAYQSGFPVAYDLGLTLLSALIAMTLCGVGSIAISNCRGWRPALGGGITGAAIGVMHYVGMAAVRAPAVAVWDWRYVVASAVIGIGDDVVSACDFIVRAVRRRLKNRPMPPAR